jgi:hypothetical protein
MGKPDFSQRVVIVTGAGKGIGRTCGGQAEPKPNPSSYTDARAARPCGQGQCPKNLESEL